MDRQSATNLHKFLQWLREQRIWTHALVSGIAMKLGTDWVAVWTRTVLADSPSFASPLGKPVIQTEGVLAFRVVAPLSELRRLLLDAWSGEIPAGRLRHLKVPIKTWCPPGKRPGRISLDRQLSAAWSKANENNPEGWPRLQLDWEGGRIADWAGNDHGRHELLSKAEQLFKTHGFGTIAELGTKLVFRHNSTDCVYSVSKHLLCAPLLARLTSTEHDRERNVIVATVEVGRRVRRGLLRIRLVQSDGRPPRAALRIPRGKGTSVRIEIFDPSEGGAEVSLSYEGIGEISSMAVNVLPRLKPWPRLTAISTIDPNLARIRLDVASKNADQHERGIALLFGLLGYASFWWTRDLPQPTGSASGRHAQDLMVFSREDTKCLVVECKTEWTKDSRINTLVGRANAMTERLKAASPAEHPWTRAVLAVSCPRVEVPNAIRENLRLNRAGLLAVDDATDLIDMMVKGFPEKEVMERFEKVFSYDGTTTFVGVV